MAHFLLVMAASLPSLTASEVVQRQPGSLPQHLYYAAARASGARYCDRDVSKLQGKAFNRRFDKRLQKVAAVVAAKDGLGWAEGDIIVGSCTRSVSHQARVRALKEFGDYLSRLEAHYDLPTTSE